MTKSELIQEYRSLLSNWNGKDLKMEEAINDLAGELMEEYGIDVESLPPTPGEQGKTNLTQEGENDTFMDTIRHRKKTFI